MNPLPAAVSVAEVPPTPAPTRSPARREAGASLPAPESLHPALWFGHQLGRTAGAAVASGFDRLDAQLPGCGWPRRALTELLLPHPGVGEIRLLAPCLAAAQREGRLVMLFDPPAQLSAGALVQLGLDIEQLLVVHTRTRVVPGSDSLWAFEQALKSSHVGALIAWLPPRLRAERLRRLQLAAHAHDGPAFVLRETAAAQRPSVAPLRIALRAGGPDALALRLLKRRGPPLEEPLVLELPSVLSAAARQRALAGRSAAVPREVEASLHAATFINLAQ
jgi:protein ImuA